MLMQTPARSVVCCLLLIFAGSDITWSRQGETSALSVLRSQTALVAEELVQKITLPQDAVLNIKVEGFTNGDFISNVFLEALQKRGRTVSESAANTELQISVLAFGVSYDDPALGTWKRTTRTSLEARLKENTSGKIEYLGSSDYSKTDVVSQKESGWWVMNDGALMANSSPGAFEKLLIPIAVIAATAITVYLFFTVRN